jgi:hypothetical protein
MAIDEQINHLRDEIKEALLCMEDALRARRIPIVAHATFSTTAAISS